MRRYDRELSLEIDRTVRRFNNKIKRLQSEQNELELPEPITRLDIVTSTAKKSTIEKKLKEYQKFLNRGVEEIITTPGGVSLTKYELNRLRYMQKSARMSLSREINKIKDLKITIFGVEQAGTFRTMGDPYYRELVSKRKAISEDVYQLDEEHLARRKELLAKIQQRKQRQEIFKSSYLEMIERLGYMCGIDKRKVDILKEKFKTLSPAQINLLINKDKGVKAILEYYMEAIRLLRKNNKDISSLVNDVEDVYDSLVNNIDEIIENAQIYG